MITEHDWNETPDSAVVPPDLYVLVVQRTEWVQSRKGKLMLNVASTIKDPPTWRDTIVFNRYVLGTDDDPQADRPETWKRRSARELKQFLLAANGGNLAAMTGNVETDVTNVLGKTYCAILDVEVDNDPQSEYRGTENQRFRKYFALGDPKAPKPGEVRVTTRPGAPAPR